MIVNCDKFKALVPIVKESDIFVTGQDSVYYLFHYNKLSKVIIIHYINIYKQYDNEGKLKNVSATWSNKTYETEEPALKALCTCIKDIKEFNNLLRILQANADF